MAGQLAPGRGIDDDVDGSPSRFGLHPLTELGHERRAQGFADPESTAQAGDAGGRGSCLHDPQFPLPLPQRPLGTDAHAAAAAVAHFRENHEVPAHEAEGLELAKIHAGSAQPA